MTFKRSDAIGVSADEQQQQEGTSTLEVARAIFQASWKYNEGRRVDDILLFDCLSVPAQVMLCDMACAAEMIWDRFAAESRELKLWNGAELFFEIYTNKHPLSSEGYGDWESAPRDLKTFWYRVAEDAMAAYELYKNRPRASSWMELRMETNS